jgi:hypothetical protein
MRRYIVLLLITGIVWAQTDFDKLVLKDGTTFLGEYSKIEGEMVYFKPQNAFDFIPVFVKRIERLELKDGRILYDVSNVKYSLSTEEYQKLSTKEKAIYDAKSKNLLNWALYAPTSIITFGGCVLLYENLKGGEFWDSSIFLGGSSAASLSIPYFVLNRKEKFNFPKLILTDFEKEIYKQAYSKKLRQRKFKNVVGSTIVTGAVISLIYMNIMSNFHLDFDFGGV